MDVWKIFTIEEVTQFGLWRDDENEVSICIDLYANRVRFWKKPNSSFLPWLQHRNKRGGRESQVINAFTCFFKGEVVFHFPPKIVVEIRMVL